MKAALPDLKFLILLASVPMTIFVFVGTTGEKPRNEQTGLFFCQSSRLEIGFLKLFHLYFTCSKIDMCTTAYPHFYIFSGFVLGKCYFPQRLYTCYVENSF